MVCLASIFQPFLQLDIPHFHPLDYFFKGLNSSVWAYKSTGIHSFLMIAAHLSYSIC